ncbi:MAG TPA: aminotransferase class V-fold PLP-dependent enzyme [Candidatus Limnocylindrales bacterium]|nr:aminotransferase class V-fold PLP-dependent enzyme [Candidatus Limnocylindrales bacterium]
MDPTSPERARALDAADPLGAFRARFAIPDPDLVYLDANSLGRPPLAAIDAVERVAREAWPIELVRGWDRWLDRPLEVGDLLATGVLGALPGEVAVTDSTTVNLYRLASAAVDARPDRRAVAIARSEFPTDRYVVEGLAASRGLAIRWIDDDPVVGVTLADVDRVLDADLALLVLSHVGYRSAAIADLAAITSRVRDAGALVLWDLSHAAGAVPVELAAVGADLAAGCTYKYLNGGPGAPGYVYIRRELQAELRPPIQGWFAQADQFAMGPAFQPRSGVAGWLTGTPGIIGLAAAEAGIALAAEAGVERLRAKGIALTEYVIEIYDAWLAPLGCRLGSPRDAGSRGAHVAIRHPAAERLTGELIGRGVIPDFRAPDSIRIGCSPLTTSFEEVRRGLEVLRELLVRRQ